MRWGKNKMKNIKMRGSKGRIKNIQIILGEQLDKIGFSRKQRSSSVPTRSRCILTSCTVRQTFNFARYERAFFDLHYQCHRCLGKVFMSRSSRYKARNKKQSSNLFQHRLGNRWAANGPRGCGKKTHRAYLHNLHGSVFRRCFFWFT